jgi:hypothetical protein
MLSDAKRKLVWVPDGGLANPSAPTVAELGAGGVLDISCLVTAANFALGATGEDAVTDPALCAEGNDSSPGRVNYQGAMDFFRWTTTAEDKAWNTFTDKGIAGHLVQRIGKRFDDPFVAGDEVQVYQSITGTPMILAPEGGGYEKFRQNYYIQSAGTDERATVVA